MLPPDTCSTLLPWRVMVPVMQISGCFPYRMSAKSGPPAFSLPLCLWGVSLQLLLLPVFFGACFRISKLCLTHELGITAFVYTCAVSMTIVWLTPLLVGVKSATLAALLDDLSRVPAIFPPPAYRWYCRPVTLAFLSLFMLLTAILTYYFTAWNYVLFLEVLSILISCFTYNVYRVLPKQLCSMVFGLLTRRLVTATEATVATVSMLLAPNGAFTCESDGVAAMLALRDLDAVIREVEVQRETAARYFFPVVTLSLMMSVLEGTVCPYVILTGKGLGYLTVLALLLGYYFMFSFCHVGQVFINKVIIAEGLLKDLKVKSRNHLLTMEVSQVMRSLSPMLTFDMCGWYKLDHASLLTISNTILTYIVIIFQVGRNTVVNFSPSYNTTDDAST